MHDSARRGSDVSDNFHLDEMDLSLLHAMQFSPRAPWARLQQVLEVDASTLSRRWSNLSQAGLAWVTAHPGATTRLGSIALVEVACAPGTREAVIEELCADPYVWTIELTTGSRDLLLTVAVRGLQELDNHVATRVAPVTGVVATRTHFVRRIFREGSSWRLNALSSQQKQSLTRDSPTVAPAPSRPSAFEIDLMKALACDGRRSASSIAADLGKSVAAVTRGIDRLVASSHASLRCEIAHDIAGWRATATLYLNVRHGDLLPVATSLSALPQVRLCVSTANAPNLMCQLWMNDMDELDFIEGHIAERYPEVRVDDRWISARFAKRAGHLISAEGRRTGCIAPEFFDVAHG